MTSPAIEIRRLSFLGPKVEPCFVEFAAGLNVFYGPTETGKSFIVDAIDFMLGGRELRPIPEREKYDTVLLWIKVENKEFSLQRSADGKGFLWSDGHHERLNQEQATALSAIHNSKSDGNLSQTLLNLLGLPGKQVAISKDNVRGLSFRDLVHLAIVDEDNIWSKMSPALSANNVETPARKSVFRLALTGIDASSLVVIKEANERVETLRQQREAISTLATQYAARSAHLDESATRSRLSDVEARIKELGESIAADELQYNNALHERRRYSDSKDAAASRYRRLQLLLSRFELLQQHYNSDLDRLEAIAQAGSIFDAIHGGNCPVCGAEPNHHAADAACNFDTEPLLIAVAAETARIKSLLNGLSESISALKADMGDAQNRETEYEAARNNAADRASRLAPLVRDRRRGVTSLATEMFSLNQAVAQFDVLKAFSDQKRDLEGQIEATLPKETTTDLTLSPACSAKFASAVEQLLLAWRVRIHPAKAAGYLSLRGCGVQWGWSNPSDLSVSIASVRVRPRCRRNHSPV